MNGPTSLQIDLANMCNADCVICWRHSPLAIKKPSSEWKARVLPATVIAELLRDVCSMNTLLRVNFVGKGEPLLHPDIGSILGDAKTRGLRVGLTTNLVARNAPLAIAADEVTVSIHAASEDVYRAMHPGFRGGEWTLLQTNLATLVRRKRRVRHTHVVNCLNAHELADMVRFGAATGASAVRFSLAILGNGMEVVRITEEQRSQLAEEWIPQARAESSRLGVVADLDVLEFQISAGCDGTIPIHEVGCHLGMSFSRITADQTVLFCCNPQMVVGSLLKRRFSELWWSEEWQALRNSLSMGKYSPCCQRCANLRQNLRFVNAAPKKSVGAPCRAAS